MEVIRDGEEARKKEKDKKILKQKKREIEQNALMEKKHLKDVEYAKLLLKNEENLKNNMMLNESAIPVKMKDEEVLATKLATKVNKTTEKARPIIPKRKVSSKLPAPTKK